MLQRVKGIQGDKDLKKLLALLLIFPIFISAEDIEYPIELTCESGAWIHQISITGKNEGWIQQISGPKKNIHVPSLDYGEKHFFKNNLKKMIYQ